MSFFIEFTKFNKNQIILFILCIIIGFIYHFILYKYNESHKENNYSFFIFLKNISLLFTIILYLKEEPKNIKIFILDSNQIIKNKEKIFNIFEIENLFIIIIISTIDFLDGNILYEKKVGSHIAQVLSFILFLKLFNQKLYKHHLLGINLCIISYIFDNGLYNNRNNLLHFANSTIIYCLVGCNFVLEKYMIEKKYCNRFLLLYYKGIFGIIITLISQIIYLFLDSNKLINFKLLINNKYYLNIFYVIFVLLFEIILIINITKTKNIIVFFFFIFTRFIFTFYFSKSFSLHYINKGDNKLYKIFFRILNVFGALIFAEIIILNFCKYNENVEKEIIKRAKKEKNEIEFIFNK